MQKLDIRNIYGTIDDTLFGNICIEKKIRGLGPGVRVTNSLSSQKRGGCGSAY
jgi:hypothetical protein